MQEKNRPGGRRYIVGTPAWRSLSVFCGMKGFYLMTNYLQEETGREAGDPDMERRHAESCRYLWHDGLLYLKHKSSFNRRNRPGGRRSNNVMPTWRNLSVFAV